MFENLLLIINISNQPNYLRQSRRLTLVLPRLPPLTTTILSLCLVVSNEKRFEAGTGGMSMEPTITIVVDDSVEVQCLLSR